jgi:hypothetical protein
MAADATRTGRAASLRRRPPRRRTRRSTRTRRARHHRPADRSASLSQASGPWLVFSHADANRSRRRTVSGSAAVSASARNRSAFSRQRRASFDTKLMRPCIPFSSPERLSRALLLVERTGCGRRRRERENGIQSALVDPDDLTAPIANEGRFRSHKANRPFAPGAATRAAENDGVRAHGAIAMETVDIREGRPVFGRAQR